MFCHSITYHPKYSTKPNMVSVRKKNWIAYPIAAIKRLPAKSILLFIQNQRGGTVSAQPTMPTTRPKTAPNTPTISDAGEGSSSRYRPPKTMAIGLTN